YGYSSIWNCGGLNAPHKRTSTLTLLKRKNIDIALLQETHLLKADMGRFADRFFHTIAFSSADTKTKGVAIVVRRSLPVKIATSWADESGR
uniref:Endonuclease/exonuclease/phosphatase domain-containing protein n=1 Tax=Takifugu rubripes TaxID=31033 RepID=A0A674P791_TAKRU